MDLRFRQLECFLILADVLNFGRAATVANTSQPALTFLIKSMEATVGTELFTRDKRHVELTPAGAQLVDVARSILSQARGYEESVRSLSVGRSLRIFCSQAGERRILPAMLRFLAKRAPDWKMEFCPIRPIDYASALLENRADVLLMVRSFEAPGVTFFPMAREPWRAVVSGTSPLTKDDSVSMRKLATRPLLVPGPHFCNSFRPLLRELFKPFGVQPEMVDAPLSLPVRFALVAAGKGNLICTESQAQLSAAPVKVLPIRESLPPCEQGAAWRSNFDPSALSILEQAVSEAVAEAPVMTQ
jgi:DNA-binding transcriptional LysR family regulator